MPDVPTHLALGGIEILLALSRPLANLSAGLYVPGNMRGIMAAGLAGEVRVRAGRSIEEELLAQRPFSLGNAYATAAGGLAASGVSLLAHGITSAEPGETPRTTHVERALRAALTLFDDSAIRSATLPLMEIAAGSLDGRGQGLALAALLAGHMRRGSRLRRVTVAGLDPEFLAGLRQGLLDAGALAVEA